MTGLRLYKKEKLRSAVAIGQLFGPGSGADSSLAYPLRALWRENSARSSADCPQFLITVPKKRLRHAVDRVLMRRRIREAYRLSRHLIPMHRRLDIAFVYVASGLTPYSDVERAMRRLLSRLSHSLSTDSADETRR